MKFLGKAKLRHLGALGMLGALAGGLCLATPSVAGAQGGGTLYVSTSGTDHGSCRINACQTINYAVTQATTGSVISVAAGSYPEQLVINDAADLTIKGVGAVTLNPSSLAASDTNNDTGSPEYPIVDIIGGTVNLKHLTIDGSGPSSQFTGCGDGFDGVYYHNANGKMTGDTVENIYLPVGPPSGLFGCQLGNDVLVRSDASDTSNVTLGTGTTLNTYQKNGIFCEDVGTTCSVTDTTISGIGPNPYIAGNGIVGLDVASFTATGNAVSDNSYTGGGVENEASGLLFFDVGSLSATDNVVSSNDNNIYLGDDGTGPAASGWNISGNTVSDATDNVSGGESGYGDGIVVDSTTFPLTVSGNTVNGNAEYGIALYGASNSTVSGNHANKNDVDGIYVGGPGSVVTSGSSSNTISGNVLKKNANDGILADADSSTNTFTSNNGTNNVNGYDFQDLSSGANTWTTNTCTPAHDSSPAGLC